MLTLGGIYSSNCQKDARAELDSAQDDTTSMKVHDIYRKGRGNYWQHEKSKTLHHLMEIHFEVVNAVTIKQGKGQESPNEATYLQNPGSV